MAQRILVINPGSTSTRIAVFDGDRELLNQEVSCPPEELARAATSIEQIPMRTATVLEALQSAGLEIRDLSAIVSRGGPLAPVPGGTYRINQAMLDDARSERYVDHVSRIGCIIAEQLAAADKIPSFVVDPVSVDEYDELARISGLPEVPRRSLTHALNIRSCAHRLAAERGLVMEDLSLIIAHLGGGISIAAVSGGRIVDSVDANGEGPMSPERSGGLPVDALVDFCFSCGEDRKGIKRRLIRAGGLTAHLNTSDAREVEARIDSGDQDALQIYRAMAYQVSKHIAAMSAVLCGQVDSIVITGGLARSSRLLDWIRQRISFLGPVVIYPGQEEMHSLRDGALRALYGKEKPRIYPGGEGEI